MSRDLLQSQAVRLGQLIAERDALQEAINADRETLPIHIGRLDSINATIAAMQGYSTFYKPGLTSEQPEVVAERQRRNG